eukprot:TRINITY_DN31282_c0_g1_i1.p1 TRINITY_DN31282_c0_g1~~TRINITY_DN31282_c0_g1_i1.p1  ORF type:complete len:677 (+),score=132.93 TRINITY_DN31282_c0_g1_i1:190-2031(+)
MDSNNNGKIEYAEFVRWVSQTEDNGEVSQLWEVASPGAPLPKGPLARLDAIIAMSPHLAGNMTYQEGRKALEDGEDDRAALLADRLLIQLESDANRIDAAFMRFDYSGSGYLDESEMRAMFQYLGLPDPAEDAEMKAILEQLDPDSSGKMDKEEFKHFVEKFGGCDALFSRRRGSVMRERSGSGLKHSSTFSQEDMLEHFAEAGIEPDSQAYWELVLPESELEAVCHLTPCQKRAVSNIRCIAKVNHAKALPVLQRRVAKLGFKDMDLWTTLSWVRDFAPVIVHFWFDRMCKFLLEDTHYRSQFETGSSCGLNNREVRERWERDLFQGAYDGCKDFERPKYGVLNVHNDYRGVVRAAQYGDCYMILKDFRLRTTFSPEDSANLKAERLACLDYYAHVLNEYTDQELVETLKVAVTGKIGSSDSIASSGLKYKEAQYHGEVAFAQHVERIVLPQVDKYTNRVDDIEAVCAKNGWEWCWMDEEKARREAAEADGDDDAKVKAWKQKLKAMCEGPKDPSKGPRVAEGFCVKACGKPVAPGLTKSGNPYKTCCRGCALGFGHDAICGLKDGERPPCKMHCGMLAADGKTKRGKPLDTCCRGCAKGGGHDARCSQDPV